MSTRPRLKRLTTKEIRTHKNMNTGGKFFTRAQVLAMAKERGLKHLYIPKRNAFLNINDDVVRIVNYATLSQIFKEAGKDGILEKYQIYYRMFDQPRLKEVSQYLKGAGPDADPDWRLLVDCETLFGWRPTEGGREIWEKVKNWVNNDFSPSLGVDDHQYEQYLRAAMQELLKPGPRSKKNDMTLQEFCQNVSLMGTSGSSFCPEDKTDIAVTYKGANIDIDKNKYATTLSMDTNERVARMRQMLRQKAKVSIKTELYPKVRLIVSSDYWTSMKMRYIRTFLDDWLRESGWSTLWSSKTQLFDMWRKSCTDEGLNVPIDQTAFDHKVNKHKQIRIILDEIRMLIRREGNQDQKDIMETVIYAMEKGKVYYNAPDGKYSTDWESGILSGWDWTALLDTMLNYCEYLIAKMYLKDKHNYELDTRLINVQGDDQNFKTNNYESGLRYWLAMCCQGLDINPAKNFFSHNHNEYLRKGMTKENINGYPSRMVNAMCWVYPGSRDKYDTLTKLKNMCDKWVKLGERMNTDLTTLLSDDLKGAKIPKNLCRAYIHSPVTLGGLGVNPTNNKKMESMPGEWQGNVHIESAGYEEFINRFGKYQSRELKRWVISALNATPALEKANALTPSSFGISNTEIKPYPFKITIIDKLRTLRNHSDIPTSLVFGSSDELLEHVFPDVKKYIQMGRAPKTWIYDFLLGRLTVPNPGTKALSKEFFSMAAIPYHNSLYSAMYYKRMQRNKWLSLSLYYEEHIPQIITNKYPNLIMRG